MRYLLSLLMICCGILYPTIKNSAFAGDLPAYQLYTDKGKKTTYDKMLKSLSEKKFVFIGEYHNNPICHWLQFEITKDLHAVHRKKLVLGAEMFEADNQFIINEYLNGFITAKNFQDEVRLWSNYNTDYKPLLEFAKANGVPFIATNIPRRYASMTYKRGLASLDSLSDLAKSFMIPLDQFTFDSTVTCYKEMIASMGGHGGAAIAQAQAIKDATMAWFIHQNTDKKNTFIHYNGAYHSNNHEGILYYLKQWEDESTMITLSTVEQKDISSLEKNNEQLADFIICVPENMTKTH